MIELLVVIAVIGLLATIVLVSLDSARKKARDARRASEIRNIGTALEVYFLNRNPGVYPTAGLSTTGIPGTVGTALAGDNLMTSPLPDDPITTRHYNWANNSGSNQVYCIYVLDEADANYFLAGPNGAGKRTPGGGAPTTATCLKNTN